LSLSCSIGLIHHHHRIIRLSLEGFVAAPLSFRVQFFRSFFSTRFTVAIYLKKKKTEIVPEDLHQKKSRKKSEKGTLLLSKTCSLAVDPSLSYNAFIYFILPLFPSGSFIFFFDLMLLLLRIVCLGICFALPNVYCFHPFSLFIFSAALFFSVTFRSLLFTMS
jgi:hypothetical protein